MRAILIIDSDLLVRQGLLSVLEGEFRSAILGQAAGSREASAQLALRVWDLAIVALNHAPADWQLLTLVRRAQPSSPVLVLSARPDPAQAARACQLGACGYAGKDLARAELLRTIQAAMAGRKQFDAGSSGEAAGEPMARRGLSAREYSVLIALGGGKRVGEVAAELNLSCKTVSTYKRRIMAKLELASDVELVRYVVNQRLS